MGARYNADKKKENGSLRGQKCQLISSTELSTDCMKTEHTEHSHCRGHRGQRRKQESKDDYENRG